MGAFENSKVRIGAMRFRVGLGVVGLVFVATACGGGSLGSPVPMLDADQAVLRASRENPFPNTSLVIFRWSVREPDLRIGGSGFARLQHPDRARLDLFMDNGEAVLAASLVEDKLRAREGTRLEVVPSPALLWASLGVFRPGGDVTLLGAEALDDDSYRLQYRLPDGDELRYEFELRSGRVTEVELRHGGSLTHRVALNREGGGELPKEAIDRNLAAFSELKVTVETVERVDSHPSDIWYLGP
jgi:hypothetical protein